MALEILESRIAPALTIAHPLPDVKVGVGQKTLSIDLDNLLAPSGTYHTQVTFDTNLDMDPGPGVNFGKITLELFDDVAPLNVQNFLNYVQAKSATGDYTGTFFERLVSGFVLQGGSFNADANLSQIATSYPVHNEYGMANTRYTVATAKIPGDPNSGTSAFFVNLADNTSVLSAQNGGFTVFGRVVEASQPVIDKIAALTPMNLTPNQSSAYTAVPTQNGYSADPDNSTATPPPVPRADQLVTITSVEVVKSKPVLSGVTYSVNITDLQGAPTRVVTGSVTGDTLNLAYNQRMAGEVKVSVTAKQGAESVTDDFQVTLRPNLITSVTDSLPGLIVPGDDGLATVRIANTGGGYLSGRVDVKLFMTALNSLTGEPEGTPAQIGSLANVPLSLLSGAQTSLRAKIEVQEKLTADQGTSYVVSTSITPVAGTTLTELFTDDNTDYAPTAHQLFNVFGTFNTTDGLRSNVPLTYVDAAGHRVTMTLANGGYGQLFLPEEGSTSAITAPDLNTNNTTGRSILNVTLNDRLAHTPLGNVIVNSFAQGLAPVSMGQMNMGPVDLTGNFEAGGGLTKLTLGNLVPAGGATGSVFIGAYSESAVQKVAVSFGEVTDFDFLSNTAVSSFAAKSWKNVNTPQESVTKTLPDGSTTMVMQENAETIRANYMDSLSIQGNLEADFDLINSAKMKSFVVGGQLNGSVVHTGGSVDVVNLGSIKQSSFFVGLNAKPTSLNSFVPYALVQSFTVKGSVGADSVIAAAGIAQASVGSIENQGNGTGTFGFFVDQLLQYRRGSVVLKNLQAAQTGDAVGNFAVRVF